MNGLDARVRRGLADLPADWDLLAEHSSFIAARRFLATVDGGDAFRVEVRDGDRLRAAVPGWIADGSGHEFLEPTRLLAELDVGDGPHVMVGAPWGFVAEILGHVGDRRAIAALCEALREHAESRRAAGVVALYLDDRSLALLAGQHVAPVLLGFDAVIDVPDGFERWLADLPRHRRGRVRAELRAFERAGLTMSIAHDERSIRELVPILCASEARHGHTLPPDVLEAALLRQREHCGAAFRIFAARDGSGRMVAGATAFVDRHALHMRICGVDRERAGAAFEYFHVCYYAPLRQAAALGCTQVRLGMESYEAKLLRGARLEPRWAVELGGRAWDRRAVAAWNHRALAELAALCERFPTAMDREAHERIVAMIA